MDGDNPLFQLPKVLLYYAYVRVCVCVSFWRVLNCLIDLPTVFFSFSNRRSKFTEKDRQAGRQAGRHTTTTTAIERLNSFISTSQ